MWQTIRNHPLAAFAALLAHVLFIAVLLFSFDFGEAPPAGNGEKVEIIDAVAVDEKQVQAELERIRAAERRKQQAAQRAKEARLKEQRRLAELKKKRAAEEKRRKLEAKKRKQREALEKKRLAELEKKRKEAERKRKQEEARLAELEKKRLEEEERARRAEEARQEAELKRKLEAERAAREALARRQASQAINKYRSLIKRAVTRHWNIPANASRDLKCIVKVRIIPSGDVVDVQIIQSSGDAAFDNSVEKAVYRAAPLPVPPAESGLFDNFREVNFEFEPRNHT